MTDADRGLNQGPRTHRSHLGVSAGGQIAERGREGRGGQSRRERWPAPQNEGAAGCIGDTDAQLQAPTRKRALGRSGPRVDAFVSSTPFVTSMGGPRAQDAQRSVVAVRSAGRRNFDQIGPPTLACSARAWQKRAQRRSTPALALDNLERGFAIARACPGTPSEPCRHGRERFCVVHGRAHPSERRRRASEAR